MVVRQVSYLVFPLSFGIVNWPIDQRFDNICVFLQVLSTPSEAVQRAVCGCLSPLMPPLASDKPYLESLISRLITTLTTGTSYGERWGKLEASHLIVKHPIESTTIKMIIPFWIMRQRLEPSHS